MDGPEATDLSTDFEELPREKFELSELGDLPFRLANIGWSRQRLRHGLSVRLEGEPGIGTVRWLIRLVAAAIGFATATAGGGD